MKTRLPADAAIDAEVDLCGAGGEYFLQARLNVSLPGLEREVAQALVTAHQTCPYTKATRGNISVVTNLVENRICDSYRISSHTLGCGGIVFVGTTVSQLERDRCSKKSTIIAAIVAAFLPSPSLPPGSA